jgi:hypothetical protein
MSSILAARLFMILGGLGIAAGAFVPTYVARPETVTRHEHGTLYIYSGPAAPMSPWELQDAIALVGWLFLLLPHALGAMIVFAHLFDRVGRGARYLFQGIAIVALAPLALGTIIFALQAVVGAIAGNAASDWVVAGGAAMTTLAAFAVTLRAMLPSELSRASPRMRLLLFQGILCFLLGGWLICAMISVGRAMPAHVLGLPSLALLLVGTHLAARAELRSRSNPGATAA